MNGDEKACHDGTDFVCNALARTLLSHISIGALVDCDKTYCSLVDMRAVLYIENPSLPTRITLWWPTLLTNTTPMWQYKEPSRKTYTL